MINLKCKCGSVSGVLENVSSSNSIHIVCYCDDCRAYARFLKTESNTLDANGGSEILQLAPKRLKIENGREFLRVVRLSDKGMFRWYADCCKSPIANTAGTPKLPFAGVLHSFIDLKPGETIDGLFGPVIAKVQARHAYGELPQDAHATFPLSLLGRIVRFLAKGFLFGEARPSPFFNSETGRPNVKESVLSSVERDALRPKR